MYGSFISFLKSFYELIMSITFTIAKHFKALIFSPSSFVSAVSGTTEKEGSDRLTTALLKCGENNLSLKTFFLHFVIFFNRIFFKKR